MKHDGISVLHGFAWEGGILEQVGTSTFKPGRGRDDEHFLNLTIWMNQYHFEFWVIASVSLPVSYISWLCIVWKIWRGVRSIAESKRDLVLLSSFSMAYVLKICTEKCTWSAPPCKGQQTRRSANKQTSKQTNKQTSKQTNKQTSKQTNMKHTPAFAQGASDAQDPAGESDDAEDSHEKSMSFDFWYELATCNLQTTGTLFP